MARKILFKIWKFPALSETFIINQMIVAKRLGFETHILVGELLDYRENSDTKLFQEERILENVILEDYKIPASKFLRAVQAAVYFVKNKGIRSYVKGFSKISGWGFLESVFILEFYKNLDHFDTIHIQFGTNKSPVDFLKEIGFLKCKVIVSFHGHDLYFPINNRIENKGYYNHLFKVAEYVVANTEFLKKKLLKLNAPEERLKVIPVSVNTEIFKPKKHDNPVTRLVSIGRLEKFKGHEWGILAVKKLIDLGYNLHYTIIGEGNERKSLEKLIEDLKLEEYVFMMGKKQPQEIASFLPQQDIFLMTSVTDPDYGVESQGLVTAEAQACGLPVVAFDSGGTKYTIIDGESGFLCKEKDVSCFSKNIEKLLLSETLRVGMGLKARNFVEKEFSDNAVYKKWINIYS